MHLLLHRMLFYILHSHIIPLDKVLLHVYVRRFRLQNTCSIDVSYLDGMLAMIQLFVPLMTITWNYTWESNYLYSNNLIWVSICKHSLINPRTIPYRTTLLMIAQNFNQLLNLDKDIVISRSYHLSGSNLVNNIYYLLFRIRIMHFPLLDHLYLTELFPYLFQIM